MSAWFEGEVTLLPFPYLRVGVLLACGISGVCRLRRRSRLPFVVRHGLGFVDRVLWPLDGPGTCCFLEPYLGFFPLASSVGCWVEVYPWLSSLRSLAVEGVDLVLCQVLVGLPSWCCCASGLLGLVVFLLFLLGYLSQVQSGSSSVHDRDVAFPPLVGFAFGLSAVPLPQADAVGFGLCWSAGLSGLLTCRC